MLVAGDGDWYCIRIGYKIGGEKIMGEWRWRQYQAEDIEALVDAGGVGLISWPTGAGKTAGALEVLRRLDAERIVITAPLNTFGGWARHVEMFMPHLPVYYVGRDTEEEVLARLKAKEAGVWVVGWEYGRGAYRYPKNAAGKRTGQTEVIREQLDWSKYPVDAIIYDESARAGNRKSTQTKVMQSARKVPIKMALSATPAGNRPENIFSTLRFLWPNRFKYFGPWSDTFLKKERNIFADKRLKGGKTIPGYTAVGEKRPGIIRDSMPTFIKRTVEEVHGELPPIVPHVVEVDLTPGQRKVYRQFEKQALAWLDGGIVATPEVITKMIRMRQVCLAVPMVDEDEQVMFKDDAKSAKLDMMQDVIVDLPEDEKVIIWTHSRRIIPVILKRLGDQAVAAIGGQSRAERDRVLDEFKHGDARFLVATIPTLAEGVDGLQHVCSTEIWLSHDDSLMLNLQAQGRTLRPGQTKTINRYIIVARDTLETRQMGRLKTTELRLLEGDML